MDWFVADNQPHARGLAAFHRSITHPEGIVRVEKAMAIVIADVLRCWFQPSGPFSFLVGMLIQQQNHGACLQGDQAPR